MYPQVITPEEAPMLQANIKCTIQKVNEVLEYEQARMTITASSELIVHDVKTNDVIFCVDLTPEVIIVKKNPDRMTIVDHYQLVDIEMIESEGIKFERACEALQIKIIERSQNDECKEVKPMKSYKTEVANTIDTAAVTVAENLVYGAGLLGYGIDTAGRVFREQVAGETYKTDVKVPGIIRGSFWASAQATGFASWASGLVIDGIVGGTSFVASSVLVPTVSLITGAGASNGDSSDEEEPVSYLTSAKEIVVSSASGVGAIWNAATESKDILVKDITSTTRQTVGHVLGNDIANMSADTITTVNNCATIASNTSGVSAVAKKIAKKAATATIKQTVKNVKEQRKEEKKEQQEQEEQVLECSAIEQS